MARNAFSDHMFQEPSLTDAIEFQNKIGRAFVSILVKNRAGEIDLQKIDLTASIDPKI